MPAYTGKPIVVQADQVTLTGATGIAGKLNTAGVPLVLTFTGTGVPASATVELTFQFNGKNYVAHLTDWVIYDGANYYVFPDADFVKFFA